MGDGLLEQVSALVGADLQQARDVNDGDTEGLAFPLVPLERTLDGLEDAETVADTADRVDGGQGLERQAQLSVATAIVLELLLELLKPALQLRSVPRVRVTTHLARSSFPLSPPPGVPPSNSVSP